MWGIGARKKERLTGGRACRKVREGLTEKEILDLDLKGIVGDWQVNTMQKGSPGDGVCRGVEMCILETTSADHFKRFWNTKQITLFLCLKHFSGSHTLHSGLRHHAVTPFPQAHQAPVTAAFLLFLKVSHLVLTSRPWHLLFQPPRTLIPQIHSPCPHQFEKRSLIFRSQLKCHISLESHSDYSSQSSLPAYL